MYIICNKLTNITLLFLEKVDGSHVPIIQSNPSAGSEYWKHRLDYWNKMFDDVKLGKKASTGTE